MADVTVEAAMLAGHSRGMRALVFINDKIGYMFGINGDSDMDYMKTTDGGQTWGAAIDILTGTVEAFDVWYDGWTPGWQGSKDIHIWMVEGGTNDDIRYCRLNTTNDSQLDVTAVNLSTTVAGRGQFVSGCRARGGNLYLAFNIDDGTEVGFYRSLDNGASWSSKTSPMEANLDQCKLYPANLVDPNDIWLLYNDDSTDELTVKTYDDSANSFSESSALTFVNENTDATGQYGFDGAIRFSDGHLIFAFFNAYDSATGDFLVYDWDGTNLNALTALTTDIDDMYYPGVFINNKNDDIYIAYVGKSDGSDTLTTSTTIYYAKSVDRGVTWTIDLAYQEGAASDYRQCWVPLGGDRFYIVWTDISSLALLGNFVNSKSFGPVNFINFMSVKAQGVSNSGNLNVS